MRAAAACVAPRRVHRKSMQIEPIAIKMAVVAASPARRAMAKAKTKTRARETDQHRHPVTNVRAVAGKATHELSV